MKKLFALWQLWKADRYFIVIERPDKIMEAHFFSDSKFSGDVFLQIHEHNTKIAEERA